MAITRAQAKEIKSLSTKKGRRLRQRFLAEGVRLLEEAERSRWLPELVLLSPPDMSEREKKLATLFARRGVRVEEISRRDFESLATTETPQGMAAVFAIPRWDLKQLYPDAFRKILWCENVTDPGNVGTLARSALAFGFSAVLLSGRSVEPFAPKVIRASAGAIFGLKLIQCGNAEVLEFASTTRRLILAADPDGEPDDCLSAPETKNSRLLLAIGAEAEGLSDEILSAAKYRVRIRHSDKVESLNAAIAGSILMNRMYEIDRNAS